MLLEETQALDEMVRKYGVRHVVYRLARLCETHAGRGAQLPYDTDMGDEMIDASDLKQVAQTLRGDLY